jgi:Fe-S-cluster containining protein
MTICPVAGHVLGRRLSRRTPFSFSCVRCRRCCHDKIIRLNPYETARLSRNLGMSTSRFLRNHTEAGGTALRRNPDGTCPFLSAGGCAVHPDRPLVCRLYPLGRHVAGDGGESFSRSVLEPGCEGALGRKGSVQGYLDSQGAGPFIEAVARYLALSGRMIRELRRRSEKDAGAAGRIAAACVEPHPGSAVSHPGGLDMDPVVRKYCSTRGLPVPDDPEGKMALHVLALEEMLAEP